MLFRAQVRAQALALLSASITAAGAVVSTSKDTPVQSGKTPSIVIYTDDVKEGTGGSPPQFRTTVLTTVEVNVEAVTKEAAESLCDSICDTVENTLLGTPAFVRLFELIDSVETTCDYTGIAAKMHTFRAVLEIKAHTTEIFEPTFVTPLKGFNIYVDSVAPFDANINVQPPFNYPVKPPPRDSGPSGSPQIAACVDLEQVVVTENGDAIVTETGEEIVTL